MKPPAKVVKKAFAYVVQGNRLLVFEQPEFPEAGVQVPAGTVEEGETPERAVVREAQEESGLVLVGPPIPLGVADFDARPFGKDELHVRHFFRLDFRGEAPERWQHAERHAAGDAGRPITFALYWVPVSDAATRLVASHGRFLGALGS